MARPVGSLQWRRPAAAAAGRRLLLVLLAAPVAAAQVQPEDDPAIRGVMLGKQQQVHVATPSAPAASDTRASDARARLLRPPDLCLCVLPQQVARSTCACWRARRLLPRPLVQVMSLAPGTTAANHASSRWQTGRTSPLCSMSRRLANSPGAQHALQFMCSRQGSNLGLAIASASQRMWRVCAQGNGNGHGAQHSLQQVQLSHGNAGRTRLTAATGTVSRGSAGVLMAKRRVQQTRRSILLCLSLTCCAITLLPLLLGMAARWSTTSTTPTTSAPTWTTSRVH